MLTIFQKSDAEITEQVVQELRWDCRTEKSPIRVSVTDGVVMLSGQVKYYAVKRAAEEAAHRIAGVASVQNALTVLVPASEFRADFEIAEAVASAFAWNVFLPTEKITVSILNGVVTLSGTVNCLSERAEAERAVINLLGVKDIKNALTVQAQPIAAEAVCADIQSTLERQAIQDAPRVKVEMEQGAVRLSGAVPSWNERCAVISAAGFAHGVQQVVDDLKITAALRTA